MAMTSGPRLGGMVPSAEAFAPGRVTEWVQSDGRLQSDVRAEVRRIPSWRNALSVVSVYTQTIGLVMFAVWAGPWAWLPVFVLMGRLLHRIRAMFRLSSIVVSPISPIRFSLQMR